MIQIKETDRLSWAEFVEILIEFVIALIAVMLMHRVYPAGAQSRGIYGLQIRETQYKRFNRAQGCSTCLKYSKLQTGYLTVKCDTIIGSLPYFFYIVLITLQQDVNRIRMTRAGVVQMADSQNRQRVRGISKLPDGTGRDGTERRPVWGLSTPG